MCLFGPKVDHLMESAPLNKSFSRIIKFMKCIVQTHQSYVWRSLLSSKHPTMISYSILTSLVIFLSHILAFIANLMFYIHFFVAKKQQKSICGNRL